MITSLDAAVIEKLGDICTLVGDMRRGSGVPEGLVARGDRQPMHHRTVFAAAGTRRNWWAGAPCATGTRQSTKWRGRE